MLHFRLFDKFQFIAYIERSKIPDEPSVVLLNFGWCLRRSISIVNVSCGYSVPSKSNRATFIFDVPFLIIVILYKTLEFINYFTTKPFISIYHFLVNLLLILFTFIYILHRL